MTWVAMAMGSVAVAAALAGCLMDSMQVSFASLAPLCAFLLACGDGV